MKKSIISILAVCIHLWATAQDCNNFCTVKNADGQILSSGEYLTDNLFTNDQIKVLTIMYADDVLSYNNAGNEIVVDRLLDVYYPADSLTVLQQNGDTLQRMPVVFLLHSKNGTKESISTKAYEYAARGMVAVTMNYRSDDEPVSYCLKVEGMVYKSIQDVRAAIRTFTVYTTLSRQNTDAEIITNYGTSFLPIAQILRTIRADLNSYFIGGYSYGSTIALNTILRANQDDFPAYLYSEGGITITGAAGEHHFPEYGLLDDVGSTLVSGFPFPVERFKGVICRTSLVTDMDIVDFSGHPHPVPVCFFHGTCDALIPYEGRTLTTYDPETDFCDPHHTVISSGETVNSLPLHGSYKIKQALAAENSYYEMYTFCGGGHNTNDCVNDLIYEKSFAFIKNAICNGINWAQPKEQSYLFDPVNYSDQCCTDTAVVDLLNRPPCLCDSDNPPILLDPVEFCAMNQCPDLEYCPTAIDSRSISDFQVQITSQNQHEIELTISASAHIGELPFKIFSPQGKLLLSQKLNVVSGTTHFRIPISLPAAIYVYQAGPVSGKFIVY